MRSMNRGCALLSRSKSDDVASNGAKRVEMVEKTPAWQQQRAADTARWCERVERGAAVYPVEVHGTTFDLMERFGGLKDSKTGDRQVVATALGKLLRRALAALLREEDASRR
jgi:hypothetical protein